MLFWLVFKLNNFNTVSGLIPPYMLSHYPLSSKYLCPAHTQGILNNNQIYDFLINYGMKHLIPGLQRRFDDIIHNSKIVSGFQNIHVFIRIRQGLKKEAAPDKYGKAEAVAAAR